MNKLVMVQADGGSKTRPACLAESWELCKLPLARDMA